MKRSLETYTEHIKRKAVMTQQLFKTAYKSFPGIEDLIQSNPAEDDLYSAIQGWINGYKGSPNTVAIYFSLLKQYLHYRGLKLHPLDIKQNLVFPARYEEELHPLSREEFLRILEEAKPARRTMYLAQTSSGMRIGELVQLRKKHLNIHSARITVKIPAAFTKRRRARTTFFSKEVSVTLLPKLRTMGESDLVFGSSEDQYRAARTEMEYLRRILRRIGLGTKYPFNGRSMITTHSFRAYFITHASRIDANMAKYLAGQKGYLLQYDRPTDEEKLEYYLKLEPDLLVYDQSRTLSKIRRMKKEFHNELDLVKHQNAELMLRLKRMEEHVMRQSGQNGPSPF